MLPCGVPNQPPCLDAGDAVALTLDPNEDVRWIIEVVPVVAQTSTHGDCRRTHATPQVLCLSDWIKMIGTDTSRRAAQMVEDQAFRYRAVSQLVGEPMYASALVSDGEDAVSACGGQSRPQPAVPARVDSGPESTERTVVDVWEK